MKSAPLVASPSRRRSSRRRPRRRSKRSPRGSSCPPWIACDPRGLSSPEARTPVEPWYGDHGSSVVSEATTCTHMHMCTSAMLARSGRRGGGLFDRAVSDNCRMLVEAKSRVCGRHTQSLLRKARGGSAHDHEHDLGATAGVRARSWAAAARTVAQGGRRRAQLRRGRRGSAQAVPAVPRRRCLKHKFSGIEELSPQGTWSTRALPSAHGGDKHTPPTQNERVPPLRRSRRPCGTSGWPWGE